MVIDMTLIVDTNKISEEIKKLDKYIKEYNDNRYDIFYEISKLDSYWKDDNANYFKEKIAKEKNKCIQILDNMQKVNNFYKELEDNYKKVNNDGDSRNI